MLSVLFVEDDKEAIITILDRIDQDESGIEHCVCDFHEAEEKIRSLRPDIVVLDLFEGPLNEENNRGSEHLNFIWEKQFCPVIVHTGLPDALEGYENPFVQVLKKGGSSEEEVLKAISRFEPHVQALKDTEDYIRDSLSFAMRDIAPFAFDTFSQVEQRNDAIRRAGRRRLAAMMDEYLGNSQLLASWEQYLCPPLSNDILLGDILREADKDVNDPTSFRVVLTPSCDLASGGNRIRNVCKVLVAKCSSTKSGFEHTIMKDWKPSQLKKRLRSTVLSRGYIEAIMPFPELKGRFPSMVANLRELELIPICDIKPDGHKFIRVASLDSPFRELVSWVYIQVTGRLGLPDRDLDPWRDDIVAEHRSNESL